MGYKKIQLMKVAIFAFLAGIFALMSPSVLARPISYPGGWTLMQQNNWEHSRIHAHYSPNFYNSLGLVVEDFHEQDLYNVNVQWNYLLGRNNTQDSQANLYLRSQVGLAFLEGDQQFNSALGVAGDWETRRLFASYAANFRYTNQFDEGSFHQEARIGVAPYVAEYGGLHTWLMIQVEHHPSEFHAENEFVVTPLVRLFMGDYLAEFGVNSNGDFLFNWIVRF